MQMPDDALIVLKTGLPPARGRKIRYYREAVFRSRVQPPPLVPALKASDAVAPPDVMPTLASSADPLTLETIAPMLEAEGLDPLPAAGASPAAVEAWVERYLDATDHLTLAEVHHGC
jgi:type IV secretion system protein VirD4